VPSLRETAVSGNILDWRFLTNPGDLPEIAPGVRGIMITGLDYIVIEAIYV
jgi:hypothetical protein